MFSFSNLLWTILVGLLTSGIVAWLGSVLSKRKSRFHLRTIRKSSNVYYVRSVGDIAIQVQYKGREVKSSLLVLRLILDNDGKQDIRFDTHFSQGVTIKNDSFSFVGAVAKESPANPSFTYGSDGSVTLKWDILKAGEKIDFELIAEPKEMVEGIVDEDRLYKALRFDFRADCIDSINLEERKVSFPISVPIMNWVLILSSTFLWFFLYVCYLGSNMHFSTENLTNKTGLASIGYSTLFDKFLVLEDTKLVIIAPKEMPQYLELSATTLGPADLFLSKALEVSILVLIALSILLAILYSLLCLMRRRSGARKQSKILLGDVFYER